MSEQTWLIEPKDPLIVRNGRPFGPNPGSRAYSLPFPFPATVAGGIRTRAGLDENGAFDSNRIEEILKIGIRGPLLVERQPDTDQWQWLVPTPRDAVFLANGEDNGINLHQLRPLGWGNALSDHMELAPVGMTVDAQGKPHKQSPRFWYWAQFEAWLMHNQAEPQSLTDEALASYGHNGPQPDLRIHVAIDANSYTGLDGALFATGGLTFWHQAKSSLAHLKQLGLAFVAHIPQQPEAAQLAPRSGYGPFGGERRIMRWQTLSQQLPSLPEQLVAQIVATKACRLILLTPAHFDAGWQPHQLLQPAYGVQPQLKAAVVGKPDTISGWDFKEDKPKPTRRLAPSGSVYYLQLDGDDEAIRSWVAAHWFRNISDSPDDNLAGFGLAALGTWDGQIEPVEEPHA